MLSRTELSPALAAPPAPDPPPATELHLDAHEADDDPLRLAIEAGGLGLWQMDLDTGRIRWWPGMERLHGMPPGAPAPDTATYHELIHPDDRERFRQAVQQSVAGSGWHRVEYRVNRPDGGLSWLEARGRVRRDAAGQAVSIAGVCVDITRRKQTETDLKFLARASAELAGVADWQSTLDHIAQLAVPAFADWCAIDLLQADGSLQRVAAAHVDAAKVELAHELHRRFPPDPAAPAGTWSILRTGQAVLSPRITDETLEARTFDPELLRILRGLGLRSYIGVPLTVRGRTLGVLTFTTAESGREYDGGDLSLAQDLASRAAVAIDNAQLVGAMREADRAKDVFLATLAHELRNPLAPIWNGLSLVRRAGGDEQRIEHAVGVMERQVGQLARLVDDLLDVSRIGTNKIELLRQPTNLVHVLGAAVEMSRPNIEAMHHKLSIAFPDASTGLVGDPGRLAQVFANLLNNAAKYTRRGGRIDVTVEAFPAELRVRVRDNGIGIEPAMLGKVFGLFTQVQQACERKQGGLGIGLSLVEGLVRLHGGRVEAHSAGADQGSEFVVFLPRSGPPAAPRPPADMGPGGGAPAPGTGPRRLLVVDDNEDAASTVAELLQISGHTVAVAHDGLGAVRMTAEFRPDVVLLDIGLPDIDGYEVARRIRKLEGVRQPILIALTGWGQQQDKQAALEAGFDHHWTKPVDPARLLRLGAPR